MLNKNEVVVSTLVTDKDERRPHGRPVRPAPGEETCGHGECKRRQLRVRPAPGEKTAGTAMPSARARHGARRHSGHLRHGAMAAKQTPPDAYICPITSEMMSDPVSTSDGFTYEREAILEWLRSGNTTSPLSGAVLERNDLGFITRVRSDGLFATDGDDRHICPWPQ